MPRILRAYSQEVFHFTENFIRIVLPSAKPEDGQRVGEKVGEKLSLNRQLIIKAMRETPQISQKELAERVGIAPKNIETNIKFLKKHGWVKRMGPARGGYWEVLK